MIGWVSLIVLSLIICAGPSSALPNLSPPDAPSFAGFNEINPGKTSFLVVSDTQRTSNWEFWRERNDKERRLVADEISRRAPAFVLHLGDLTTRGSSVEEWQEFDALYSGVREQRIPCFPLPGNHEYYGNDGKALDNYFERFPYLGKKRWYSFIWKNMGLILVDSNFTSLSREERLQQVKWYQEEIEKFEKAPDINHIIVCSHAPPFTNNRVVNPSNEVRTFFVDPFLRSSKGRLFLSGHAHTYERFLLGKKYFVVSGGGGGPRHKVQTDPRKRLFDDLFEGPELRFFHFCEIEPHNHDVVLRMIRLQPDGTFSMADTVTIGAGGLIKKS